MNRANPLNVKFNLDKSQFCQKTVNFMGHKL